MPEFWVSRKYAKPLQHSAILSYVRKEIVSEISNILIKKQKNLKTSRLPEKEQGNVFIEEHPNWSSKNQFLEIVACNLPVVF